MKWSAIIGRHRSQDARFGRDGPDKPSVSRHILSGAKGCSSKTHGYRVPREAPNTSPKVLSVPRSSPVLARAGQFNAFCASRMGTFEALEGWQRLDEFAGLPLGEADLIKRSEEHTSELQSLRHLGCRL